MADDYRNFFLWKGINSLDYSIVCSNPDFTVPAKNIKLVTIPGRSGFVSADDDSFSAVAKTIECRLLDDSKMEFLPTWLNGNGKLIFSGERDKYYEAVINKAVPFEYMLRQYRAFTLTFNCQPFKYSVNHNTDKKHITASGQTFYGQGTFPALPIITVYGNGTVYLTINGVSITLANVSDYITINSKIMECYKDNVNANAQMTGAFPTLKPNGEMNIITYSGSVSEIEIQPFWRWI